MLGVVKLFLLRFQAGDVYPAYSSLRSDPLGSRAFYRSLQNLNKAAVSRNYLRLQNLKFIKTVGANSGSDLKQQTGKLLHLRKVIPLRVHA